MIIASTSLLPTWLRITNIEATLPLGLMAATHLLWPFALNPWFISFSVSVPIVRWIKLTVSSRRIVGLLIFGLLGQP